MKLGKHFQGTSEELKDFCENHGFDPTVFLNKPKQYKVHWGYIATFTILFIIISLIIWISPINEDLKKGLIVFDFLLIIINAITVHLKYERWIITTITIIGFALIMELCLNILTPEQALEELKEINPIEQKA